MKQEEFHAGSELRSCLRRSWELVSTSSFKPPPLKWWGASFLPTLTQHQSLYFQGWQSTECSSNRPPRKGTSLLRCSCVETNWGWKARRSPLAPVESSLGWMWGGAFKEGTSPPLEGLSTLLPFHLQWPIRVRGEVLTHTLLQPHKMAEKSVSMCETHRRNHRMMAHLTTPENKLPHTIQGGNRV